VQEHSRATGGFRLILLTGAIISVAIGIWGFLWTTMLETILGLDVTYPGAARMYGGVMLAVGVGYALAAAQPHRNRGLLVPLFLVPLLAAIVTITGVARDEIQTAKGVGFVIYNLAYCLLYFRLYPRVPEAETPVVPNT
jgi:hypothetical protein